MPGKHWYTQESDICALYPRKILTMKTPLKKLTPVKTTAVVGTVLNAFIAQAGTCSRRKAVELIKQGRVTVNGNVMKEPGYRVTARDVVQVQQNQLVDQEKVYILLNKPKDCITTVSDEKGRKTVMPLIADATKARVFPVGRLDRSTTGLLLFTNDGFLAQALSHPKNHIQKTYHVFLDKPVHGDDIEQLRRGVMLEDGKATVDAIAYIRGYKDAITVTLHSGKNRIVRRMFEHVGYEVVKLDRVGYAGLTKRNLLVGQWRMLTAHEIKRLRSVC